VRKASKQLEDLLRTGPISLLHLNRGRVNILRLIIITIPAFDISGEVHKIASARNFG